MSIVFKGKKPVHSEKTKQRCSYGDRPELLLAKLERDPYFQKTTQVQANSRSGAHAKLSTIYPDIPYKPMHPNSR